MKTDALLHVLSYLGGAITAFFGFMFTVNHVDGIVARAGEAMCDHAAKGERVWYIETTHIFRSEYFVLCTDGRMFKLNPTTKVIREPHPKERKNPHTV